MKIAAYCILVLSSLLMLLWPIAAYTTIFLFDAHGGKAFFELKRYAMAVGLLSPQEARELVEQTYCNFSAFPVRSAGTAVFGGARFRQIIRLGVSCSESPCMLEVCWL